MDFKDAFTLAANFDNKRLLSAKKSIETNFKVQREEQGFNFDKLPRAFKEMYLWDLSSKAWE